MMNSLSTKPFAKKTFYLDLKGFPNEKKLAQDLKLLGGIHEACLTKTVSFVVSNRTPPVKTQFWSPATPLSNPRSMSPHLFNDCVLEGIDSPTYTDIPGLEQNSCLKFRGMSLVQKAREKMKQVGTCDVLETCKKWNIKVYHVQKVLSCVEKYKHLYYKNHMAEQKHGFKKLPKSSENVQKIHAPFIKIEDSKKKYKTRYKVFTSWTNIIDPELSQFVCELRKNLKVSGTIDNSFRLPLKELCPKSIRSSQSTCTDRSASLSKMSACNTGLVSTSVSVYAPNDGGKENHSQSHAKRKGKDSKKKSRRRYCEICDVHFSDIETHLEKKLHENYMSNEHHYAKVQEIIASFPQVDEFIASLQEKELSEESSQDCFPEVVPVLESECETDLYDACVMIKGDETENCMTELYSVLQPDDYISASCSSSLGTPFPYLEPVFGDIISKCNEDLGPPTLVYYNTVETGQSFPEKLFLPFKGTLEISEKCLVNHIVTNTPDEVNTDIKADANKVESSYCSGSNSSDVLMKNVNSIEISYTQDIETEFYCQKPKQTTTVLKHSDFNMLDTSCPQLLLPDLFSAESNFPPSVDAVKNYSNDLTLQNQSMFPLADSVISKMDFHSFKSNTVQVSSEKNAFCYQPIVESDQNEFKPENAICHETNIKRLTSEFDHQSFAIVTAERAECTSSNTSKQEKDSELKRGQAILCCRNLIKEFENVALQISNKNVECKNSDFKVSINDVQCKDDSVSNGACFADVDNLINPKYAKEIQVLAPVMSNTGNDATFFKSNKLPASPPKVCWAAPDISHKNLELCLNFETMNADSNKLNENVTSDSKSSDLVSCFKDSLFEKLLYDTEVLDLSKNGKCTESNINIPSLPAHPCSERTLQTVSKSAETSRYETNFADNISYSEKSVCSSSDDKMKIESSAGDSPDSVLHIDENSVNDSVNKMEDVIIVVESLVSFVCNSKKQDNNSCSYSLLDGNSIANESIALGTSNTANLEVLNKESVHKNIQKTYDERGIEVDLESNDRITRLCFETSKNMEIDQVNEIPFSQASNCDMSSANLCNGGVTKNEMDFGNSKLSNEIVPFDQENIFNPFKHYVKDSEASKPLTKYEKFAMKFDVSPKTAAEIWNSNVFYVLDEAEEDDSEISKMDCCDDSAHDYFGEYSYTVPHTLNLNGQSIWNCAADNSHSYLDQEVEEMAFSNSTLNLNVIRNSSSVVTDAERNINVVCLNSPACSEQTLNSKTDKQNSENITTNAENDLSFQNFPTSNFSSNFKNENCSNEEASFSSSPEKETAWAFIHHEVDTLCKSIDDDDEENALDLRINYQSYDPPALVMQH